MAAVFVGDQAALRNEITAAPYDILTVIELTNNITLTVSALTIPVNKKIILTGAYTLSQSANAVATIIVNGELTIDGITVTHNVDQTGRGVQVNNGGTLIIGLASGFFSRPHRYAIAVTTSTSGL